MLSLFNLIRTYNLYHTTYLNLLNKKYILLLLNHFHAKSTKRMFMKLYINLAYAPDITKLLKDNLTKFF